MPVLNVAPGQTLIRAPEESMDPLGWKAFLKELEAQAAIDRANDPEGMAALEAEWSAKVEAARAKDERRYQEQEQHTRELGRLRVARFRARRKARQSAFCKRQQIATFMEAWKRLSYQQQEESADVFHVIIESMAEELQALEQESILTKRRPRRNARPVPVIGGSVLVH